MFAIEVSKVFSAAHALRLPGGGTEPLHGHDFHVTVRLIARQLDALETVVDFHLVEAALEAIIGPWRNRNLNDVATFSSRVNPSAERIAEQIGTRLGEALAKDGGSAEAQARGLEVAEVRVSEAPGCVGIWLSK